MAEPAFTRRTLIGAGAGALTGALTAPRSVLAALAPAPRGTLRELWLGDLAPGRHAVTLGARADLVGLEWQGPACARAQLRFRTERAGWSAWVSATGCAAGAGQDAAGARARGLTGEAIWTGGTSAVQLRAAGSLAGVRLHLVDVSGGLGAGRLAAASGLLGHASALPQAQPVLAAGPGQPPIIARQAWAQGLAHPRVAPAYGEVRMAFVHHTQTPNGYVRAEVAPMLRAIFAYHRYVRGWNDIGYNFLVDAYGRIFEGRAGGIDEPVVGAQAGGYNAESSGVAMLGSFMSAPVSPPAAASLARLLAWKLALHGVPANGRVKVRVNPAGANYSRFPAGASVSLPHIAGHRDGDSTDCPGDALYHELGGLRGRVARLQGNVVRLTLALIAPAAPSLQPQVTPQTPAPPAQPPAQPPQEAWQLSGSLARLDGTPVVSAPILIQARSTSRRGELVRERTIAQALTGAAGGFSLALGAGAEPGPHGALSFLRALYPGSPAPGPGAALSAPIRVPSVLLSEPAATSPTPTAAPPPSP